jgi:phosphoribosylamine--glycine ligase
MRLLVIGSGGREHALVWKLAQSQHTQQLWCAPGNAGIGRERLVASGQLASCVALGAEDLAGLLEFAQAERPDLTVVGPDNPLALGIVDEFQAAGLKVWGPNRRAAQFEASKVFSQEFMQRHSIPTMRAGVFTDVRESSRFAAELGGRCAVKADGLALGKGVLICRDMAMADAAIEAMLVKKQFGAASERVVIQELLQGIEVSLHVLCDGRTMRLFPTSQDHKPAFDNDEGPNTGGMGAYSPAPFLSEADLENLHRQILEPWLRGCQAEGIDYRGMLYPGLMLTHEGAKVLEFNSRFGDPETQVYLPRLENDLVELLMACVDGTLEKVSLRWKSDAAVCVVMASGGYPGSYAKGKVIDGLETVDRLPNAKVFHAGTALKEDRVVTSGGRVLGVTAWADGVASARSAAYTAVQGIQFEEAHYRRDIANKALV